MPKTNVGKMERVNLSLPGEMIAEVDRLVTDCPIFGNRQQFVESALRDRILKARVEQAALYNAEKQHQ